MRRQGACSSQEPEVLIGETVTGTGCSSAASTVTHSYVILNDWTRLVVGRVPRGDVVNNSFGTFVPRGCDHSSIPGSISESFLKMYVLLSASIAVAAYARWPTNGRQEGCVCQMRVSKWARPSYQTHAAIHGFDGYQHAHLRRDLNHRSAWRQARNN